MSSNPAPVELRVPFARAAFGAREQRYVAEALAGGRVQGDGPFSQRCERLLSSRFGAARAFLTSSGTDALEMAMLLADIGPGDEVIVPSFTFVSTANAVVLRGATPVFVDVRADTLNLDEVLVAQAITSRTRAIVPVHYAGVACEMDALKRLARQHELLVIEDAAHGIDAAYRGESLGAIGDLGIFSFHETKNVSCGEGGALLLRDETLARRAEIIREKGTDRKSFLRGEVDKYTWREIGSSFLPSDLTAAVLLGQLERLSDLTRHRLEIYDIYREMLAPLESEGVTLPYVPQECRHNAHIFHLRLASLERREALRAHLAAQGIQATSHYVPLHSSEAGRRFGRAAGALPITDQVASTILRLPIHAAMTTAAAELVAHAVLAFFPSRLRPRAAALPPQWRGTARDASQSLG